MLRPEDFAKVYGMTFTGIVERIMEETTRFLCKGNLLVRSGKQLVPVIPGRSVNKLPGKPFPFDPVRDALICQQQREECERFQQANPL
jgi:hypothetical protein